MTYFKIFITKIIVLSIRIGCSNVIAFATVSSSDDVTLFGSSSSSESDKNKSDHSDTESHLKENVNITDSDIKIIDDLPSVSPNDVSIPTALGSNVKYDSEKKEIWSVAVGFVLIAIGVGIMVLIAIGSIRNTNSDISSKNISKKSRFSKSEYKISGVSKRYKNKK